MAIGRTNTGGGGAGLNYKIVDGTTQPSNPKENWIWVNTDVPITTHAFSSTEPASPIEGMVWFNIGTSSTTPINALKKNTLMVYPIACKQYISSAWIDKTAKTYQNGAWVDWDVWLYKNGNEFEDLTGGFKIASRAAGGWGNGTLTLNDSSMVISIGTTNCICVTTENAIDVTSNRTMYVKFSDVTLGSGVNAIGISSSNDFEYNPSVGGAQLPTTFLASETIGGTGLVAVDVSSITGFVYPAIALANSNKSLTVTEIYLR